LAGDALQSLAFEMVCNPAVGSGDIRAELARSLAVASGAQGMVLGQALDIAAETAQTPLTLEQITTLQQGKTGALIAWAAMAGPRLAQGDVAPLAAYANALGLAFQIADDILDIEGDAATVGKATGKDTDAGKATFVSLLGLDGAKRRAHELVQTACDALSVYGHEGDTLRETAQFVVARKS
jgi:farnesyl diphosphate synthase